MRAPFIAVTAFGVISIVYLLLRISGSSSSPPYTASLNRGGSKSGNVVIVTIFDPTQDAGLVDMIKQNRDDYAEKHGTY
jgi:hypothetical protein